MPPPGPGAPPGYGGAPPGRPMMRPPGPAPGAGAAPPAAGAPPQAPVDDEMAELEAAAAALEAEADAMEAAERAARVAAAWTAHKAPDGRVYYFNTESQESSWTKPRGFRGDASGVGGLPVPVAQAPVGETGWVEVKCVDGRK
jgi:hypothetical protein